eukprot:TRINITY_DN3093_c0_g1_i1.p1 TRINITY_DN3093_c0_g1~~TRINITY_DN3093_c0_g1_i1.p1  ORF type:complete len:1529 (-),score=220.08 TRINITY_DN3093_c0_g1_i1:3603-8189(-)
MGGAVSKNSSSGGTARGLDSVAVGVIPDGPLSVGKVQQDFTALFDRLVPAVTRHLVGDVEVFTSIYPHKTPHILELCVTDCVANVWFVHVLPHQLLEHSASTHLSWQRFSDSLAQALSMRSLQPSLPDTADAFCFMTSLSVTVVLQPDTGAVTFNANRIDFSHSSRCILHVIKALYERETAPHRYQPATAATNTSSFTFQLRPPTILPTPVAPPEVARPALSFSATPSTIGTTPSTATTSKTKGSIFSGSANEGTSRPLFTLKDVATEKSCGPESPEALCPQTAFTTNTDSDGKSFKSFRFVRRACTDDPQSFGETTQNLRSMQHLSLWRQMASIRIRDTESIILPSPPTANTPSKVRPAMLPAPPTSSSTGRPRTAQKSMKWQYMGRKGHPMCKPLNIIRVLRAWRSWMEQGTDIERLITNKISPSEFVTAVSTSHPTGDQNKQCPLVELLGEVSQLFSTARDLLAFDSLLSTRLDAEGLVRQTAQEVTRFLRCEAAALLLIDAATNTLICPYDGEEDEEDEQKLPAERVQTKVTNVPLTCGIAGFVALQGRLVNARQARQDPRFDPLVDGAGCLVVGTRSLLCVPVRDHEKRVLGVIQAVNKMPPNPDQGCIFSRSTGGGFTAEDELVLTAIAGQAGLHLHRSQLYADVLAARNEFQALLAVAQGLGSAATDAQRLVADVLRTTQRLTGAGRVVLFLVDSRRNELVSKATLEAGTENKADVNFHEIRVDISSTVPGRAVRTQCVQREPAREGMQEEMVAPVRNAEGEVIGVLQIVHREEKGNASFSEDDEMRLGAFATIAGVSLQNALLYETAMQAERRTQALLQTSVALAAAALSDNLPSVIANCAREIVNAHWAAFYTVDAASAKAAERLGASIHPDAPGHAATSTPISKQVPLGSGLIGTAALTGDTVNLCNVRCDWRYEPTYDGKAIESMLCLPIYSKRDPEVVTAVVVLLNFGEADADAKACPRSNSPSLRGRSPQASSGTLVVRRSAGALRRQLLETRRHSALDPQQKGFPDDELRMLQAFATQCAVALDNAESHAFVECVLRSIPSFVLLLDGDGCLVSSNRQLDDLLGSFIDPVGRHFTEWLAPNPQLVTDIQQVYDVGTSSLGQNMVFYPLSGIPYESPHPGSSSALYARNNTLGASWLEGESRRRTSTGTIGEANRTVNYRVVAIQPRSASPGSAAGAPTAIWGRSGVLVVLEDISPHLQQVMNLSRYLSPGVVKSLLGSSNPERPILGGVRVTCTVLFSDIRGFTSMVEKLEPQQAVASLNEYFGYMGECVLRHGGIIDKYVGDAIMAVYGHPQPQANDAVNACATALGMLEELKVLNESRAANGAPPLQIGIGINTGPVVSGNIGISRRMEYTVIGHHVNLASRAEGLTKIYSCPTIITQNTHAKVCEKFPCREIDFVIPPGTSAPIRIYELLPPAAQLAGVSQGGPTADLTADGDAMALAEAGLAGPEWVAQYEIGLQLYQRRSFSLAIQRFANALALRPGDGPSEVMIQRCRALILNPPPADWDASWRQLTK